MALSTTAATARPADGGFVATELEQSSRRRSPNADSILELAIAVLDEHGETGIRVQELSDEVGVAITTLYRFFGSREGLIATAQAERFRRQIIDEVNRLTVAIELSEGLDEFKMVFRRSLERILSPELAGARLRRANVLGSAQSRPALMGALADMQDQVNRAIAGVLERARANGWIRTDLDLVTFAVWFAGVCSGRLLIELGETSADAATWDAMTIAAIDHTLFGG